MAFQSVLFVKRGNVISGDHFDRLCQIKVIEMADGWQSRKDHGYKNTEGGDGKAKGCDINGNSKKLGAKGGKKVRRSPPANK